MILLQVAQPVVQNETSMNLFQVIAKGGWIMIPLFILAGLAVFLMTDTWMEINRLRKFNQRWFAHIIKLVYSGDIAQALEVAKKSDSALGRLAVKALQGYSLPMKTIEEDIQVEARQTIAKSEGTIGYLSLIATVAPMLGFLGTIFGVIKIFFNISLTNDFSISSVSDGLYQKMICSGAGLLVGIVAYMGFYVLNRHIDLILLKLDMGGNELLKAIASARGENGKV